METATRKDNSALLTFLTLAKEAGCPADQIQNFLKYGYVPQPKQLLFHASARMADLEDGPTEIGLGGARGGGKTHATFAQLALDDCQREPGLKALMLRKIGKAMQETVQDLRRTVLKNVEHEYKRGERILYFPNGSRIVLGNFKDEKDIDAYLGLEYDVIVVEEATTLTATKYRAIRTVNRTSKPGYRPRIYTTTNPGGIGHGWYKKRFVDPYKRGTQGRTRFVPSTVDDNKYLNKEYVESLDELTGWLKQAWRFGEWEIASGQFFGEFDEDVHVKPWFKIPENWRIWLSYDYGYNHYTVIYLCTEDPDTGDFWLVNEHAAMGWLVPQHAQAVERMLAQHDRQKHDIYYFAAPSDVFAKRGNNEFTVAELWKQEGFRLDKANQDRVNGAAEMLARLGSRENGIEPSMFVTDRCPLFKETLPLLIHDPYRPEDVMKVDADEEGEGGDDAYDSARYGLMAQAAFRKRKLKLAKNPFYS